VVTPDSPIVAISFGFRLLLSPFPSMTAVPLSRETLIFPPLPLGDYFCGICMEGGQPGNCINYTGIYCKWNMGESSISWSNACYKTIYCKHESSHSIIRTNKRHVELSQCDISEIADKIFGSIESKMKESIAKVINAHLDDECCEME
jgi:hypothetical protein